jgi:hypothetical protein
MTGLIEVSTADMIPCNKKKAKVKKQPYVKSQAVRELEQLADAEAKRLHHSCPHLAKRSFRDDSANALTTCITTYLRLLGAFCSRVNNTGIFDRRLNRYRPGTSRKGLPDVIVTYKNKSLMIEVKIKDSMSTFQEKIKQEQEASGGYWFTAHDFTEVKRWIDNL